MALPRRPRSAWISETPPKAIEASPHEASGLASPAVSLVLATLPLWMSAQGPCLGYPSGAGELFESQGIVCPADGTHAIPGYYAGREKIPAICRHGRGGPEGGSRGGGRGGGGRPGPLDSATTIQGSSVRLGVSFCGGSHVVPHLRDFQHCPAGGMVGHRLSLRAGLGSPFPVIGSTTRGWLICHAAAPKIAGGNVGRTAGCR
jgi:hypothetical protein